MEEKEIIYYFKNYIEVTENQIKNGELYMIEDIKKEHIKYIKDLLKLYKNEKEKNEKYEKQLVLDYIDNNFVSKDKIRKIIYPTDIQLSEMYKRLNKLLED